jgi:hypothetical protein
LGLRERAAARRCSQHKECEAKKSHSTMQHRCSPSFLLDDKFQRGPVGSQKNPVLDFSIYEIRSLIVEAGSFALNRSMVIP